MSGVIHSVNVSENGGVPNSQFEQQQSDLRGLKGTITSSAQRKERGILEEQ